MPKVTYGKDLLLEKNKKQAACVMKYCKDKKGLSVEELGIKLGMSRSTVNQRIKDASNMTLKAVWVQALIHWMKTQQPNWIQKHM